MQFLNVYPRRLGVECAKRKDSRKLLGCAFRMRLASDRIDGRRDSPTQVVKAITKPRKAGLHHSSGRALVRRYRDDVPGHQDSYHDIDRAGSKIEGFAGSVRVALREAVAKCGLILGGFHDSPRRNRLQVICNRIVVEPFQ